jgi:hypothetical protein
MVRHSEYNHVDVLPIKPISVAEDVDVVVVAGDTCEGALRAFEHLRRIVPMHLAIVVVLGNHGYCRRFQNASPDRAQIEQARRSGGADGVPRYAQMSDPNVVTERTLAG